MNLGTLLRLEVGVHHIHTNSLSTYSKSYANFTRYSNIDEQADIETAIQPEISTLS